MKQERENTAKKSRGCPLVTKPQMRLFVAVPSAIEPSRKRNNIIPKIAPNVVENARSTIGLSEEKSILGDKVKT